MRRRFPIANVRQIGRLLYAVAVLGVLALPVSYRGGAEVAHPHAVFQLWADGADGSTDHHRRRDEPAPVRLAEPGREVTATPVRPDVPRLTEVTPAHERPLIIPALAVLGVFLLPTQLVPVWGVGSPQIGRRLRPEVPPPRLLVAA